MVFIRPNRTLHKFLVLVIIVFLFLLFSINGNWMFEIIPIFMLVFMLFPQESMLENVTDKTKIIMYYIGIFLLTELVSESLAILQNLPLPPEQRALFHPAPLPDLLLAVFYYLPIAITTALIYTKYQYTVKGVFIVSGIYGVLTEQFFAIFLSFNPLLWIIVFTLYGSFFTIPYIIFQYKLNGIATEQGTKVHIRLFLSFFVGFVIAFILFTIVLTLFPSLA